jgi:hypothetical protein
MLREARMKVGRVDGDFRWRGAEVAGYVAIFAIYGALYLHARRKRGALELSPFESALTDAEVVHHGLLCAVGLLAIALARLLPIEVAGLSGFAYLLIGAVESWHGAREGRMRRGLSGIG